MWPPHVERIAAVLRAAGVEGRLEQLPADERLLPEPFVRSETFDCEGRTIVALIRGEDRVDRRKLALASRCTVVRPVERSSFPWADASVLLDRTVLAERVVWIEAGEPRYVVALASIQLAEVTQAQAADILAEA